MRKSLIIIALALATGGCLPQIATFPVEVKDDSGFILKAEDKDIAVFAIAGGNMSDSLAISGAAYGFAGEAENQFKSSAISAYTLPEEEFVALSRGDSTYFDNLMLESASRFLIFIKGLTFNDFTILPLDNGSEVKIPFSLEFYVYDAVKDSTLYSKRVQDLITVVVPNKINDTEGIKLSLAKNVVKIGQAIGQALIQEVTQRWKKEEWYIVDYPNFTKWHKAYLWAMDFKWKEAAKIWIEFSEDKDVTKSAYASYNIAVACQILGEKDLARQWIKAALEKFSFKEAELFEKRINAYKSDN